MNCFAQRPDYLWPQIVGTLMLYPDEHPKEIVMYHHLRVQDNLKQFCCYRYLQFTCFTFMSLPMEFVN